MDVAVGCSGGRGLGEVHVGLVGRRGPGAVSVAWLVWERLDVWLGACRAVAAVCLPCSGWVLGSVDCLLRLMREPVAWRKSCRWPASSTGSKRSENEGSKVVPSVD